MPATIRTICAIELEGLNPFSTNDMKTTYQKNGKCKIGITSQYQEWKNYIIGILPDNIITEKIKIIGQIIHYQSKYGYPDHST